MRCSPMLSFMEEELVDYLTADIEDAILNGDQAGTQDSLLEFASGVPFHDNFDEVFSEYLLAGNDVAFDADWLDWTSCFRI